MKQNFTAITAILDRSGSMHGLAQDTIGSFNTFLNDQKSAPGHAVFTLCTFADTNAIVHDFVDIKDVPNLTTQTYKPNGNTALLDALGVTINSVGAKLAAMDEADRPDKVIFLIVTDGQENASREFTKVKIKDMVEHQTNNYAWDFIYLGANVDSMAEGGSIGVAQVMNYSATSDGTKDLYKGVSESLRRYRGSSSRDFFGSK